MPTLARGWAATAPVVGSSGGAVAASSGWGGVAAAPVAEAAGGRIPRRHHGGGDVGVLGGAAAPTGSSTLVEASCSMRIWVKEARIAVEPGVVEVDCLSTAFADNDIVVTNEGDDPVEIFDISVSHPWALIVRIIDGNTVEVSLPVVLLSRHTLIATLRTDGTAVPPGLHVTNGTVSSSNGEDSFLVNMVVTPASLRVIALPSVIPTVIMRAGNAGQDSGMTDVQIASE